MATKLVIWGLDGVLNEARGDLIRRLNKRGIVSAILSHAPAAEAAPRLKALKLTDQTVFNRFGASSSGPTLRAMLADFDVAAEDALLIAAAARDRDEAEFFCSGLMTADPDTPDCDARLENLIAATKPPRKSRRAEYARLEKVQPPTPTDGDNRDFVKTCGLHVAVPRRGDCFEFAPRIAALLGNTTADAIRDGLTGYYRGFDARAVFAWDRYQQYGLVGFAAVKDGTTPVHFAVSPAAAGLGIAGWFVDMLKKPDHFPQLDIAALPFAPAPAPWIVWEPFKGPVRHAILARETGRNAATATVRIMADHQSAPLAHFAGLSDTAETDMYPRRFELRHIAGDGKLSGLVPPHLVYLAAGDYDNGRTPYGGWKNNFAAAAARFCASTAAAGARLLLVLPPETRGGFKPEWGLSRDRVAALNNVWRKCAAGQKHITLLELDDIATADELIDVRHYQPALLRRIGKLIAGWLHATEKLQAAE